MATSETGHNINVANLNKLNEVIATFGTDYDPAKIRIKLAALQDLYAAGNTEIGTVQTAKNNYSITVDQREQTFKTVKSFTTRIIANLSGTNVTKLLIKDAKSINAKIQAKRIDNPNTPQTNPEEPTENLNNDPTSSQHSISRQSHISLEENFSDLVDLLNTTAGYDPNQVEFTIEKLQIFADNLKSANENIDTAVAHVADKRIDRNIFLYNPDEGLVNTALEAKEYIKGIYGATSPQFKLANKISFKNIN
jgi:hypothetical protein